MSVKIFQLHKRSSYTYSNIQDKFSFDEQAKIVTIADGTTQSFRSALWADILTKDFLVHPFFDAKQFIQGLENTVSKFNALEFQFSENPAIAFLEKQKIEKGATSTFIGLKFQNEFIEIIACGDSNVFIVNENAAITTYPFNTIDDLDNNKSFINTAQYKDIEEKDFISTKLPIAHSDKVIVCSDALSRFLLDQPNYIQTVLSFKNYNDFFNFCITQWDAKKMQEDDISLVVIDNPINFGTSCFVPSPDFEFEKEKQYEFIPTILNEYDMNDFQNLIEALRKEFFEMNKKISKLESLVKILIYTVVANVLFTIMLSYGSFSEIVDKVKEQFNFKLIKVQKMPKEKIKLPGSTTIIIGPSQNNKNSEAPQLPTKVNVEPAAPPVKNVQQPVVAPAKPAKKLVIEKNTKDNIPLKNKN